MVDKRRNQALNKSVIQAIPMTIENAKAFLADVKANGPSADAMQKIGKDFTGEHIKAALKESGVDHHEDLLKGAAGGSAASDWTAAGGAVAGGAAAAGAA